MYEEGEKGRGRAGERVSGRGSEGSGGVGRAADASVEGELEEDRRCWRVCGVIVLFLFCLGASASAVLRAQGSDGVSWGVRGQKGNSQWPCNVRSGGCWRDAFMRATLAESGRLPTDHVRARA